MQAGSHVSYPGKWYPFTRTGLFTVIMVQHSTTGVRYAPFYIHRFPLLQPHLLLEAEKFNLCFPNPALLESTADKLRYYRYKKGLRQRDVADFANIDRRRNYLVMDENATPNLKNSESRRVNR